MSLADVYFNGYHYDDSEFVYRYYHNYSHSVRTPNDYHDNRYATACNSNKYRYFAMFGYHYH
jgi:hypothetical protein